MKNNATNKQYLKCCIILIILSLFTTGGQALAMGITIGSGATVTVSGSASITTNGNWSNSGTFTAGTGTVTLNGTNQTLSGSTTFYNLVKNVTVADTLTFANGTTQTITNSLNLQGIPAQRLSLRSNSIGVQWKIVLQAGGSQFLNYLDVKDSDASGGQTLVAGVLSIDSGNNLNWVFSGEGAGGFGYTSFHFDSLGRPRVGTSNLSRNGTIVLKSGNHTVTITVNRATGEVTMQ
jgi:hypothetical protein